MHRLFVAIRPPERVRDLLIDAMDDSPDFRWQDDQQLHLTLRFVGEVERRTLDGGEVAEPGQGDAHQNCSRKRASFSNIIRRSSMR